MGMKLVDTRRYELEERIPYPVLADDLEGTVHLMYGGLTDPTYIIGVDGRVSFIACGRTRRRSIARSLHWSVRAVPASYSADGTDGLTYCMALPTGGKGFGEERRRASGRWRRPCLVPLWGHLSETG